jgi:DNA repair photolyase
MMAKRFGKVADYKQWCSPQLVSNTLEILDREIPRLKSKIKSVHLCFTTDPFMYGYDEVGEMSISAIKKLNAAGIKCNVLTKGILPIELAEQLPINEYGISLISLDESFRKKTEPEAAPYVDRITALKTLHDKGNLTWVSIEPYPTPNLIEQDLDKILASISFVNNIIFGRTNYSKEVSAFTQHRAFYNQQASIVTAFCNEHNIKCHVKSGTITM